MPVLSLQITVTAPFINKIPKVSIVSRLFTKTPNYNIFFAVIVKATVN